MTDVLHTETRTDSDADAAEAARLEAKLARLETAEDVVVDNTEDLAAVAVAADRVAADAAALAEVVAVARAHGRSWSEIGLRLGVSRQAARQRYGMEPRR